MVLDITYEELLGLVKEGNDIEIETPDGWKSINTFFIKEKECFTIITDKKKELSCSYDHLLLSHDRWIFTRDLLPGDTIQTKDGEETIINKEYIGRKIVYDIEVDSNEHRYYTNDIISHNTGKTILAITASLQKVLKEKVYDKVIFLKPTITAHEDIGYLKGDMMMKLNPFMSSFIDNINVLKRSEALINKRTSDNFEDMVKNGVIEVEHIGFIRGRSFNNCIIIADELQNVGRPVIKTIVSRVGENCKIICLGDIDQIDASYLSKENNGFVHLCKKFMGQPVYGHITLKRCERSQVATLAASLL